MPALKSRNAVQLVKKMINQGSHIILEKTYVSDAGWYKLNYPGNWIVENEEGTLSFFDPKVGKGTLWLTVFSWGGFSQTSGRKLTPLRFIYEQYLELKSNEKYTNVQIKKEKRKIILSFEGESIEDSKNTITKYWLIGIRKVLFLFSYSYFADNRGSPVITQEQEIVDAIQGSFRLLP